MPETCDYSLLPVNACHHCSRGTDPLPSPDPPERSRSFVARYDGRCAAHCGWPIEQGERIRYDTDGAVVHARCG